MSRHLRETQQGIAGTPSNSHRAKTRPRPSHPRCRHREDPVGRNRRALDRLLPRVSPQLLAIAATYLSSEGDPGRLEPAGLVNELFLRLVEHRDMSWRNSQHFVAFAACTMRRILVDRARFLGAAKRGRGWTRVPLEEVDNRTVGRAAGERITEILALHEALVVLARNNHRQARVVYLRIFLGHSLREVAELLELSIATASRDWMIAAHWLGRRLRPSVPTTTGSNRRRAPDQRSPAIGGRAYRQTSTAGRKPKSAPRLS